MRNKCFFNDGRFDSLSKQYGPAAYSIRNNEIDYGFLFNINDKEGELKDYTRLSSTSLNEKIKGINDKLKDMTPNYRAKKVTVAKNGKKVTSLRIVFVPKEAPKKPFKRDLDYFNGDVALYEQDKLYSDAKTSDKLSPRLKNSLLSFVKGLGVEVEEDASEILKEIGFETDPLSAFDTLQKYLALSKDITNKDLTLQTANILYTFLGKKSKLGVEIWKNIENWDGYQKIYDRYKKQDVTVSEDIEWGAENFNPFAHKQAILHLIAEMLEYGIDNNFLVLNFQNILY